jgi:hypothetical protein
LHFWEIGLPAGFASLTSTAASSGAIAPASAGAAPASAIAVPLGARTRLVDVDLPVVYLVSVELLDGLRGGIAVHLDKGEPA